MEHNEEMILVTPTKEMKLMRFARSLGRSGLTVAALVIVASAAVVHAGYAGGTKAKAAKADPNVIPVTVTGENLCIPCLLKKEKGVPAQCDVYGHRHALKVTKAIGRDGKEVKKLRGWYLHYLQNDKSNALVTGHHGEKLTIKGTVYVPERILVVDSFKAAKAKDEGTTPKKPAKPKNEGTSY